MSYFEGIGKYGFSEHLVNDIDGILPVIEDIVRSEDPNSILRQGANAVTDLVGMTLMIGGATGIAIGTAEIAAGGVVPGIVSIGAGISSVAAGKVLYDLL